jgi:hypothetical protein
MDAADFKRAAELLRHPDAEDCERFSSWYGLELLDIARAQPGLIEALNDLIGLIDNVLPAYSESTVVANARVAIADTSDASDQVPGRTT